jgi:hypothetical protein
VKKRSERDRTIHPSRVIVGHCPDCWGVLVVSNDHEAWAYGWCPCGWAGATTKIANQSRYERGGIVIDLYGLRSAKDAEPTP